MQVGHGGLVWMVGLCRGIGGGPHVLRAQQNGGTKFYPRLFPPSAGVGGYEKPVEVFLMGKFGGSGVWRGREVGLRWGMKLF